MFIAAHSKNMETTNMSLTGKERSYTVMKIYTYMENRSDSENNLECKKQLPKVEYNATSINVQNKNFQAFIHFVQTVATCKGIINTKF